MTSTTTPRDDPTIHPATPASDIASRIGLKGWISALSLTMKMARLVPNTGRVTANDVEKVRAAATAF